MEFVNTTVNWAEFVNTTVNWAARKARQFLDGQKKKVLLLKIDCCKLY